MLAIVVLSVLATVQVECAPNQFWPAFQKVSAQPTKKPVFATTVNKESPSKASNPSATQHAYEQFINTWLAQASLTLNRPDILKFLNIPAQPAVSESVISPVVVKQSTAPVAVTDSQVTPVEKFVVPVTAEPSVVEPEVIADAPKVILDEAAAPKQMKPVLMEMTSEIDPFFASDPVEIIPEATEVLVDQTLVSEVLTQAAEEVIPTPAAKEFVLTPAAEEVVLTPVEEEAVMTPLTEVVAEPIPSLVEQDTATVLVALPPTPTVDPEIIPDVVVEMVPEPIVEFKSRKVLQPVSESQIVESSGRSFSSGQNTGNVIRQEPVDNYKPFPFATLDSRNVPAVQSPIPSFAASMPAVPLPAVNVPGAITTDGLAYTLQHFPTRGNSHYFVSTAIGG